MRSFKVVKSHSKLAAPNAALFNQRSFSHQTPKISSLHGHSESQKHFSSSVAESYNQSLEEGLRFFDLSEHEKALNVFNELIDSENSNAELFKARGQVFEKLGKFQQALDDYKQAIESGPSDAELFNCIGSIQRKLGRDEQALKNFDLALQIQPTNLSAIKSKVIILLEFQRLDEALQWIEYAMRWDPQAAEEHQFLKMNALKALYTSPDHRE